MRPNRRMCLPFTRQLATLDKEYFGRTHFIPSRFKLSFVYISVTLSTGHRLENYHKLASTMYHQICLRILR